MNPRSRCKPYKSIYYLRILPILIHWSELYPISKHWAELHPILIHLAELYHILIHWAELYPNLIHWVEVYPISIRWHETYPILIHCAKLYAIVINRAEYTPISLSVDNQSQVLRHPSRQPFRIEYYVVCQSESSITSPESSRLESRFLLVSRLESVCYSLS